VGFRSGTTQVFRLPGSPRVFELPLHVQDTALFFPGRMGVSESQAIALCDGLLRKFERYGGAFTVNWHDRSLVPERNWDSAYLALLGQLRERNTWFATAGDAVAWFEKRRGSRFDSTALSSGAPVVRLREEDAENGPALAIRVHQPARSTDGKKGHRKSFVDHPGRSGEWIEAGYRA
jgi:hypothetical protein